MYIKKFIAIGILLSFFALVVFTFIQHSKVKSYERNMAAIASNFSLIVSLINNTETEIDRFVSDSSGTSEADVVYIENSLLQIQGMTEPTLAALESLYDVETSLLAGELRKIIKLTIILSENEELSEQDEISVKQGQAKMEQIIKYFHDKVRQENGYYLEKENVKKQFERYNEYIKAPN